MAFWADGLEIRDIVVRNDCPMQPRPVMFVWRNREHHIDHVSTCWRIHTDWWTQNELWRDYWEVTTDTHMLIWLFYDRIGNKWYLERVME